MRDNEHLYRAFIDTCPESVLLIDVSGCIRLANPAAAGMHGYTLDELLAMNIRDLDDSADAQAVAELIRRLQVGESHRHEAVHRRKDGTSFPVEVLATPISVGNEVFILAFDRDISEQKRSELETRLLHEELANNSHLVTLSEMASGLAHELNQPLAALGLYVDTAVELAAQYDSVALNECLRRITEQLQHSGEIIRRMRGLAGRGPARREIVNINALVSEVLALLAEELKQGDTTTKLELDDSMYPVLADGIQIKQVLVNLIQNAMEGMSVCDVCDRKLVITSQALDNTVRVSVSDSGPGLDPAIAKRLFVHFQTTKPERLGLGLAISRNLIEANGGHIGVQMSSGSGTTFFFELPRSMDALLP